MYQILAFLYSAIRGVTQNRVLGRKSAGTGRAELLDGADLRSIAGVYSTSEVNAAFQPIGSYAAASHTHVAANVSDFSEAVDDRVAALLVAGTNVAITYNDAANTLTIANTASSASPGGSSGQIQFNSAGSFGGAAGLDYSPTGTHVLITTQGATTVALCLKGAASQTAILFDIQNSGGTSKFNISQNGKIRSNAAIVTPAGFQGADGPSLEMAFANYGIGTDSNGEPIVITNGVAAARLARQMSVPSNGGYNFMNTTNVGLNAAVDARIARNAAGVLEVNNGTSGTFRDFIVRNLRMSAPTLVPASASATGSEGQIAWDASFIYVCTATNTWKRVAIATW